MGLAGQTNVDLYLLFITVCKKAIFFWKSKLVKERAK